jgi:hypothetical protein
MKTSLISKTLGVLALLGSSAGMAATVTITPTTLTPTVGQTFDIVVSGDVANTVAGSLRLVFNPATVSLVEINPGAGSANARQCLPLAPFNVCTKNSPTTQIPGQLDPETANPTTGALVNILQLRFLAIAAGAANIVIDDDGGNTFGWFTADTAEWIPVSYQNASVIVQNPAPVPVPAAAWLFLSAIGGLATLKRRTQGA